MSKEDIEYRIRNGVRQIIELKLLNAFAIVGLN